MLQANFPAKIVYGENSLNFLSTLSAKRVVIFADEVFHKFNPEVFALLDSIFDTMGAQHWLYFGEGTEPTLGFIKENAKKLTEHQPDLILAIGGGSVIDAVKVMEVYYEHPDITNEQLYDRFHLPPLRRKAKLVAIPTTSGTGAEVSPIGVIYVPNDDPKIPQVKKGIADHQFIANYVILDPRFTVTCPRGVTASTAVDAFVHCIEAYVNKNPKNIFTDGFALEGMKKVVEWLPKALENPKDLTARAELQIAAAMGGMALAGRGSGASHGAGKQIATICHIPHGMSVAIPLDQVIRLNSRVCLAEYATIARYLGVKAESDEQAVEGLIAVWNDLMKLVGFPRCRSELKIEKAVWDENLDALVKNSQNDAAMKGNPIKLTDDEVRGIFNALDR